MKNRTRGLLAKRGPVSRRKRLESFLRTRVWPEIPPNIIGRRISKRERERILGYGSHGVQAVRFRAATVTERISSTGVKGAPTLVESGSSAIA